MVVQLSVRNLEEVEFDGPVDVEEEDLWVLSKPLDMIARYP